MAESRVIHVDIQGQRYAIKSGLDPKYVHDIAAYVDHKMERVGRELETSDGVRLAVMAALNIADEMFRSKQDSTGEAARLLQRAADIERIIDQSLAGTARPDAPLDGAARPVAPTRATR